MKPVGTMQGAGEGPHKLRTRSELRRNEVVGSMRIFIFQQKLHGMRVIHEVDPWHGLSTIPKGSSKEKARGKGHQWKQAPLTSQDHGISDNHATDPKFLYGPGGILPGDGELCKKVIRRRRRFIGNPFPAQAIAIDARGLQEDAWATLRVLNGRRQRTSGNDP